MKYHVPSFELNEDALVRCAILYKLNLGIGEEILYGVGDLRGSRRFEIDIEDREGAKCY